MAQAETTSTHTGVSLDFYMVILDPESEWPLTVITVRPEARGFYNTASAPSEFFFSSYHSTVMPSIDTVPEGDDENLQRLPYDTQGDTGTSDDPAGDSQPEAQQPARPAHDTQGDIGMSADPADDSQPLDINENSTAYSLPRWRKLLRSVFGIQQRGFQVGGNDPFDYEQRFPEDKRCEELSPFARVWRTYLEECGTFDIEMLEGWRDGLDVLLVFAGLFSAVVTTFVVQTSQSLQVDYGQVTATLLFELIDVQRAAANGTLVNDVPRSDLTPFSDFRPTISDSLVNGLWFTSLSFSLATALFAVLTKQWIHQYIAVPSGTPRDRCRVRQFRYMGLEQWGVGFIIGLLPVLLSASLGIFLVGLVLFLAPLQVVIASIVGAITLISFAAYFVSNFLPIMYPSCPYKTPLSQCIFLSYAYTIRLITLVSSTLTPTKPPPTKFLDIEHAAVERRADDLDVYALGWLSNMSSNPGVQNIVIQSTSALPLQSVEPLMQYVERFSETYHTVISSLDINCQESVLDRIIRASLRFNILSPPWWVANRVTERDRPSAESYAGILCVSNVNPSLTNEITNLVKAQFTESPDKLLCLQPIVWARLLQELLPFTLESGLIPLFLMIPPEYWHADYKPPPLFPKNGMKIRSISYEDHCAVSLEAAVYRHLYPDIADALFEGFMHVEDSIFHPDPATDEFSAPQDAWLRALLAMASSPSIRKVPIANPFWDSIFGTVMLNIGTYMDVDKSLLVDNFPSFKLDSNRYSVLKLLYALISPDEFSGASMCNLDQRITLVMFLRVLHSTSPHPHFLLKDWCTPFMASTFAQIVLPDTKTWTIRDNDGPGLYRESESDELILYFLWSSPIVNQMFSHFVSGCHLDRIGKLRGDDIKFNWGLPQILDTFIERMTPDVLDHQVLQQFTAHIFDPENLFTICAVHICGQSPFYLRRLAQVHPDHPAWSECLWKLDAIPLAEHFGLSVLGRDPDWIGSIVSEFREFVEGGCVGSFGMHTPDPQPPQQAPVEDEHPVHERSLMKSLPKLWHRLRQRQHCDTAAKTEEIMMNPSGISEV